MKSNRQDKKNPFGNHVGILLALSPPGIWPWPWTRARVHYAAKSSTNSYPSQLRTSGSGWYIFLSPLHLVKINNEINYKHN